MIQGEIGMIIKKIEIRKYKENDCEMTFTDINGGNLHIVGENDLEILLKDALNNIIDKSR